MSQEDVEVVRGFFEWLPSLQDRDPTEDRATLDLAFRDYLDEEFETRLPGDYPEGEPVFSGREGLARYGAMLRDAWSEWRFEPERFIDAGDRVVVFQRVVAHGQGERRTDRADQHASRDCPSRSHDGKSRIPRSLGSPPSRRA